MDYIVTKTGWIDGVYRTANSRANYTDEAAKWLRLAGLIAPAAADEAAPHPLDHDGDGKPGGSQPGDNDLTSFGSAIDLAEAAETNQINFNALRSAARQFLFDDVPAKKAEIITALRRLEPS